MKKLLIFPLLFLTLFVSAQTTHGGGTVLRTGSSFMTATVAEEEEETYTTEYQAVLTAMANDPTGDTLTWQDDMVYSLDSIGYWDRIKLFYPAVAASSIADSYINWVKPGTYNLSIGHAPVMDRVAGWVASGDDYLNTSWIPRADSLLDNHAGGTGTNDITVSSWQLTNWDAATPTIGVSDGPNQLTFFPDYDELCGRINSSNYSAVNNPGSTIGYSMISRSASNYAEGYFNGVSQSYDNDASTAMPETYPVYVLARNNAGTADLFVTGTVSIILIMDAVTDDEELKLYNILHRYMTRIGL